MKIYCEIYWNIVENCKIRLTFLYLKMVLLKIEDHNFLVHSKELVMSMLYYHNKIAYVMKGWKNWSKEQKFIEKMIYKNIIIYYQLQCDKWKWALSHGLQYKI